MRSHRWDIMTRYWQGLWSPNIGSRNTWRLLFSWNSKTMWLYRSLVNQNSLLNETFRRYSWRIFKSNFEWLLLQKKTFSQIISSKIKLSFKLEASNFIKNNFWHGRSCRIFRNFWELDPASNIWWNFFRK